MSKTHVTTIRIPDDIWKKIKAAARKENRTISNFMATRLAETVK